MYACASFTTGYDTVCVCVSVCAYMFVNSHAFSFKRHKHGRHWNGELIVTDILSLDSSNFETAERDFLYFVLAPVNHHTRSLGIRCHGSFPTGSGRRRYSVMLPQ